MSEQDLADVHAFLEEKRGHDVPDHVRSHGLAEPGFRRGAFQDRASQLFTVAIVLYCGATDHGAGAELWVTNRSLRPGR
ncbi:MAG TPA: hypothetical protein VF746_18615 [Longimicrobium sp.]